MEKKYKIALKQAGILILLLIAFRFIISWSGLGDNPWVASGDILLMMAAVLIAIKQWKDQKGQLKFFEGFKMGMLISLIVGVFSGVLAVFVYFYWDVEAFDFLKSQVVQALSESVSSEEELNILQPVMEMMLTPFPVFIVTTLYYLFHGALISTLIAFMNRS